MDDIKREVVAAFVKVIADVVDGMQFGRKVSAEKDGGRAHRLETKRSWVTEQLRRVNEAIGAARNRGVLSETVAKFSRQELSELGNEIWDFHALEMHTQVKERILGMLRERGLPEDVLREISVTANIISLEVAAGTWAPQ